MNIQEVFITADGSTSIHLPQYNESYHSKHGAIQEAYHVFIKNGFEKLNLPLVNILEIGFGTGLNAFITYLEAFKTNKIISYTAVEAFPVPFDVVMQMNYVAQLNASAHKNTFEAMHLQEWEKFFAINPYFKLNKQQKYFEDINDFQEYDLIYFDAFGYRVQPELWSEAIFNKMYQALKPNGILVTYACRSVIKKAMEKVGFTVEKLPGAPGKREMIRATKIQF